jgi:hypothetical protein
MKKVANIAMLMFGFAGMGLVAVADTVPMQEAYLIQLTFPKLPQKVPADEDAGRVDIFMGDRFIGCATPAVDRISTDTLNLHMSAVGYMARGTKEQIRIVPAGSLATYGGMVTRITRADVPIINPNGEAVR